MPTNYKRGHALEEAKKKGRLRRVFSHVPFVDHTTSVSNDMTIFEHNVTKGCDFKEIKVTLSGVEVHENSLIKLIRGVEIVNEIKPTAGANNLGTLNCKAGEIVRIETENFTATKAVVNARIEEDA